MASIASAINAKRNNRNTDSRVVELAEKSSARTKNNRDRRPLPDHRTVFMDGMDHINIWDAGRTDLGRMLSMEFNRSINVPAYGRFGSIFALWVYLTTKGHSDELRNMPNAMLRSWINGRRDRGMEIDFPNIEFICMQALAATIVRNKALREALVNSDDAKLTNYIVMRERTVTHPNASWWLQGVNLIRTQLQAGMEVDVSALCDKDFTPETAYIELDKAPALGKVFGDKPARSKKEKTSTQKEQPKQRVAGVAGGYIVSEEIDYNPNHQVFMFAAPTREELNEFKLQFLDVPRKETKNILVQNGYSASPVAAGLDNFLVNIIGKDGNESFPLFVVVDEAGSIVSISTAWFDNPFKKNGDWGLISEAVESTTIDATEGESCDIVGKALAIAGVSQSTPLAAVRIHKVNIIELNEEKPAEEAKTETPEV